MSGAALGATLHSKLNKAPRPADRQAGVAVLVGVMAFLLLGLGLFAGLRWVGPRVDLQRQQAVSGRMADTLKKSLISFVSRNKRLPCPADGSNGNPQSVTYGLESCALTDPATGIVPWKTLGLSQSQVRDSWGNMVGYAVTQGLSSGKPYNSNVPTDSVQVTVGATTPQTSTYAYVLMSFGPDGGSYNQSGAKTATSSAAKLAGASDIQHESDNRRAIADGGQATPFYAPSAAGTTGGQYLVFETSQQICNEINGKRQLYCGAYVNNDGMTAPTAGYAPLSSVQNMANSGAVSSNPNGVSSNATVIASSNSPVLVLGTSSNNPSLIVAPTLSDNSQACHWARLPMTLTAQTLRAYFEYSTVDDNVTPGHGFTFTLLPASTDIVTTTPCGGTPNGLGQGANQGSVVNDGNYLGFEAIVDGGLSGTAQATPTVDPSTGKITQIAMAGNGAGYTWVPPVEITDTGTGTGASAYVSQMALNGIVPTSAGYGYIAAPGADPRPASMSRRPGASVTPRCRM